MNATAKSTEVICEDPEVAGIALSGQLGSAQRNEAVVELCDCVIDLAAAFYGVCGKELRRNGRARQDVVKVRQIAMYVAHTTLALSMKDVGHGFARDRTTVLYAVHLVEDMRDDPQLDEIIGRTEQLARALLRGRKVWSLR